MFYEDIFYKHPDVTADMAQSKPGQISIINLFLVVPTHALHYTLNHQNLTLKHLKFAPTCFKCFSVRF